MASPSKHRLYGAAVQFDPSQYQSGSRCYRNKHFANPAFNRSALPNEVLFHELFHAWRDMKGLPGHATAAVGRGLGALYQNTEEFLAVTITNIYVSDHTNRWASGLRGDHVSHRALEKDLSSSVRFFQSSPQVLPILREFIRQAGNFCGEICNVRSSFNPIAAVMDPSLTSLLNRLSQSPTAQHRDALMPLLVPIAQTLLPSPPAPQYKEALEGIANDLATEALAVLRATPLRARP
jgi:hypothetical protein